MRKKLCRALLPVLCFVVCLSCIRAEEEPEIIYYFDAEPLKKEKALWEAQNIQNYVFRHDSFFKGVSYDLRITVKKGKAVNIEKFHSGNGYGNTISDFYKRMEKFAKYSSDISALPDNVIGVLIKVKYDETYHYPKKIIDGIGSIDITEFEVLEPDLEPLYAESRPLPQRGYRLNNIIVP